MLFRFDISVPGLLQDKKEYVEPLFTENEYAGLVMLPCYGSIFPHSGVNTLLILLISLALFQKNIIFAMS